VATAVNVAGTESASNISKSTVAIARYGGTGAPAGSGYTKIYSTKYAFAALKADGTITAWGHSRYGGTGAPAGNSCL
jgi:alpha-tubulin suppressor-like RCC1 family protein